MNLTDEQKVHLKTIKWLISSSSNSECRTTVMAIAFLEKAADNLGQNIRIFDHDVLIDKKFIAEKIKIAFKETFNAKEYVLYIRPGNAIISVTKKEVI